MGTSMSDEDEPAPSPSATVVARRASREAKSMREESGCDEDTSSDEEWDLVQEQDEEDEEDKYLINKGNKQTPHAPLLCQSERVSAESLLRECSLYGD